MTDKEIELKAEIERLRTALQSAMLFVEAVTADGRVKLSHNQTVMLGNARIRGRAALNGEKE